MAPHHYTLVPFRTRPWEALNWNNIADYQPLSAVEPGAAPWTAFGCPMFWYTDYKPAQIAQTRIIFTPTGWVRLVSSYTDNAGVAHVDNSWGEVVPNPNYGVQNAGFDMTAKWNAYWSDPIRKGYEHQFFLEVKGSGLLYGCKMEVDLHY